MTRSVLIALAIAGAAAAAAGCGSDDATTTEPASSAASSGGGELTFSDPTTIDNPYAPLTKFSRCVLTGTSDGESERVVRTLLDRTEPFEVGGQTVQAAVIEDRAIVGGELVERTLDYFAQADDGTVHYFGEDVDNYRNGKLADHSGSFRYGEDTRHLGVLMPADPRVGDVWRFEDAPPITVEEDRLVETLPQARVAGETYEDVLRVRELIDGEEVEFKLYARGVGNVQELPPDGEAHLVGCH